MSTVGHRNGGRRRHERAGSEVRRLGNFLCHVSLLVGIYFVNIPISEFGRSPALVFLTPVVISFREWSLRHPVVARVDDMNWGRGEG
jgi:hypothetical protein